MADISLDTIAIDIETTGNNIGNGIQTLTTQLTNLKTATSGSFKNINNLSTYLNNLKTASAGLTTTSTNLKSLSDIGTALAPLNNIVKPTGLTSTINQLKKLPEVVNTLDADLISEFASKIQVLTTAITPLATQVEKLSNGMAKLPTKMAAANKAIESQGKQVKKVSGYWGVFSSGVTGVITKMSLLWHGASAVVSTFKNLVYEAAQYQESFNLFSVTMGDYAQEGLKWINEFSDALYLDPSYVMQYMGTFNSLIKGLGVGADKAYIMSQNMTQLAYDLASFRNLEGGVAEAFTKIQSGISGEIEPLRNVGVALTQASLQTQLYNMGIDENIANLDEASKVQLRYIQILEQTADMQGDMGRTLTSPANLLRVLQDQFTQLARAIGNIFIPILGALVPYIMVVVEWLTILANMIADFVGFENLEFDASDSWFETDDMVSGLEDVGDAAEETTDKLNTMLAPFDELNVVQSTSTSDSDSGSDGGGTSLDLEIPTYDALQYLTDDFKEQMEEARKELKKILPIVIGIGAAFAGWKITKSIMNFLGMFAEGSSFMAGLEVFKGIFAKLGDKLAPLAAPLAVIIAAIASIVASVTSISSLIDMFKGITQEGKTLGEVLGELSAFDIWALLFSLFTFNPIVILGSLIVGVTALWQKFGDTIKGLFQGIFESIVNFLTPIVEWVNNNIIQPIWELIEPVVMGIGDLFQGLWSIVSTVFGGIFSIVSTVFSGIWAVVSSIIGTIVEIIVGVGSAVWTVMQGIFSIVAKIVEIIWTLISTLFTGIFNFIGSVLGWVNNNLIQPVLGAVGGFVVGLFSALGGIFSWINTHVIQPVVNLFVNMFNTIVNKFVFIGTTIVDTLSGIIKTGLNGVFWVVESLINGFISAINIAIGIINLIPGVEISKLSKIEIPRFADGGYPEEGQMFIAREAGPEMVGNIGNKTAVANNDQITTSITNALMTALNGVDFGGNQPQNIQVNIGNKQVYEGTGKYIDSQNDRYGTNYVKI